MVHWKHFNSEEEAKAFTVEGRVLSGNVRKFYHKATDGTALPPTYARGYTKAGELMVRAFEESARQLECPFQITGKYMLGRTWGECH